MPEAVGETAKHHGCDHQGEPRDSRFPGYGFQVRPHRRWCIHVVAQVPRGSLQVPRADHDQHVGARGRHRATQRGGHVAIALGDDRLVERGRLFREFAEGRFEHVALLELLDVGLGDILVDDHPGEQTRCHHGPTPPAQSMHRPSEGQSDIAIDEVQREVARARFHRRDLEFGAWLDAELVGQSALVTGERQIRRE